VCKAQRRNAFMAGTHLYAAHVEVSQIPSVCVALQGIIVLKNSKNPEQTYQLLENMYSKNMTSLKVAHT
jgi:hypothetical protein